MICRARSLPALLVLAPAAVSSSLLASEIPFSSALTIEAPFDFARSVASADFDGDGDVDLVGLARGSDAVAWWENAAGDGSVWSRHDLNLAFDDARQVTVGDLDGDGDVDIVATAFGGAVVSWWENDFGSGASCGFDFCEHTLVASSGPEAVELADLDRDGDLDAIVAFRATDRIRWFANAGDGTGWAFQDIATGFDGAQVLGVGDLDGDGDLDVVGGAGNAAGEFAWWENDLGVGTACGSDWCSHSLDSGVTEGVAVGDLDGDGDLDLLRSESGALSWWENQLGDASMWTETTISTTTARLGLAAVDVDGDGDVDVAGLDTGWLENVAGDASAWVDRQLPGAPTDCFDLELADFDGDGDLDAAAARSVADQVVWWRNETLHRNATFSAGLDVGSSLSLGAFVAAADLDRDGDADLVATSDGAVLRWSENDGTPIDGGWTTRTVHTGTELGGAVGADIDGDGDPDLAVCDSGAGIVLWLENDGSPADGWQPHTVASGLDSPNFVDASDIDADGDLDLVVSSLGGGSVWWFENDGTPADAEWTGTAVATGLDTASAVATFDADGDGDVDVLATDASNGLVVWSENDGSPADGWAQHTIATGFGGAFAVVPCDIDGDGDLDVLAASRSLDTVAWFENDGTPADTTWPEHEVTTSFNSPKRVVCGDFDADGDADVAATASIASDVAVWLSDGTPADGGWQRVDVDTSFFDALGLAAADFDGDGRLDLAATAHLGSRLRWWRNVGGQFALPTADAVTTTDPNAGTAEVLLLEIGGVHRGRSGDADAELSTLVLWFVDGADDPLSGSQLDALVDTVRLYLDDGDGIFDPDTDGNFFSLGSPFPDPAVLELSMVDADPSVQVAVGADVTWWVAVDLAAGAASATPDAFRVVHVTSSGLIVPTLSTGEMSTTDLPLELEEQNSVVSAVVDVNQPPTLDSPIADDSAFAGATYSYDVSGTFSDPEAGALSFGAAGLPASLAISSGGVISGTPTVAEVAGSPYAVAVTATDPNGATAMDSFDLTILPSGTIVVDGICTLTDAILSANTDTDLGSCTGAGGVETIVLDVDVTLTAADTAHSSDVADARAGLPDITTEMRIEAGLGSTIARDASLTCLSDGVDRFRLLQILDSGGLTLVGVTLENGCAPRGGAVYVLGNGVYLDAINSTFRANAAQGVVGTQLTAEGGALLIGTNSELTLEGCLFEGNGAYGFSAGDGFGGAIFVRSGASPVSIVGSDFVGNEAVGGDNPIIGGQGRGGAIACERSLDLADAILADNLAQGGSGTGAGGPATAGAIYLPADSLSHIERAVFDGNLAVGGDSADLGGQASAGALQVSSVAMTDTAIVGGGAFGGDGDNGGDATGGGLRVAGQLVRVTVASTRAQGGMGATGHGGNVSGGAMYSEGALDLLSVTLSGGRAEGGASISGTGGGAIGGGWHEADEASGAVTVRHLSAVDNAAIGGAGATAGAAAGGTLWLSRSGIQIVSALLAHGSIAPGGGTATPDDCATLNPIASLGYNVVEAPGTCVFAATGDQSGVDPGVRPLGLYGCTTPLPDGRCLPVHPIHIDGAAVDQGSCTVSGTTTDARGFARPFDLGGIANADDGCDAGAYEVRDANANGIDDGFEIFADGFESGDTSGWSATIP